MSLDIPSNDTSTDDLKNEIPTDNLKKSKPISVFKNNKKYLKKIIILCLLVLSLPLALAVMKLSTNLTPKADVSSEASYLSFSFQESQSGAYKSTSPTAVNSTVTVDINLVNAEDLVHVVTGVDALVSYDKDILEPIEIKNGLVFKSLTREVVSKDNGLIEISGSYSKIKDDLGNPVGYAGNGGVLASVVFKTKQEGNAKLSFVYNGGQDTSDSNIIAFKKGEVVSSQMPQERFLQKPTDFIVEVAAEIAQATPSPTVALSGRCEACNGSLSPSVPNSRCEEGLICKYEGYADNEVVRVGAAGFCVEADETFASCQFISSPKPTIKPSPAPITRPQAQLQIKVSMLNRRSLEWRTMSNTGSVGGESAQQFLTEGNYATKGVLYGVEVLGQVKGVAIASALGDLNEEFKENSYVVPVMHSCILGYSWCEPKQRCINTSEESCEEIPGGDVDEHGCKGSAGYSWCEPKQKCLRTFEESCEENSDLIKIADFVTDRNGLATVIIPEQYEGKTMYLFVRTPSHLIKFAEGEAITLPVVPGCLYKDPTALCDLAMTIEKFEFVNLIPGDIYIAPGESEQDNIINTFDAIKLIKHLGESSIGIDSATKYSASSTLILPHRADLNGDDVVNTRDLKILIDHLGERGKNSFDDEGIEWKNTRTEYLL